MRLEAWNRLIDKLGVKECNEKFIELVDTYRHTKDPKVLVRNPVFEAMLEDRLNDIRATNSQQDKATSVIVAAS